MEIGALAEALMKGGPLGVLILAAYILLGKFKELREADAKAAKERAESDAKAAAERDAERHRALSDLARSHEAAVTTVVGGFERTLDRLERQHTRLADGLDTLRSDVHALRVDVHGIAAKTTAELPAVPDLAPSKKSG